MNLIRIAKERCANWDNSTGRCFGISAEVLRGEPGRVQALDHCKLKDGERCAYFERCVLPGVPKQNRQKSVDLYLENKGLTRAVLQDLRKTTRTEEIEKTFKKQKDLRAHVKSRLKAGRAS